MLLARELIGYLSRQLVKRLMLKSIDTGNPQGITELIQGIILHEMEAEDRLNEDVHELLGQYSDYMRREGLSYQEMFRKIKNQLITQRKIVRASGRDTNDNMKLSRDKITDVSHKLVAALKKSRDLRVKRPDNDVRLEIVGGFTELLVAEEKVDREARQKIRSQKREILEGSEEWEILHQRYYSEELKKFGIDLAS
jgi:hypothetical protein